MFLQFYCFLQEALPSSSQQDAVFNIGTNKCAFLHCALCTLLYHGMATIAKMHIAYQLILEIFKHVSVLVGVDTILSI